MGESHSYSVGATPEPEPTLEDAAQAIDAAEQQEAEEKANQGPYTYEEERPEWLPEKFESAEAMAQAYSELESKLGQPAEPQAEEATEEAPPSQDVAVNAAVEEFTENGQLSEETYKVLEAQGLPKTMVDTYIAGQQAIINQQQMEITNEIGGMQEYQKLSSWASEELSDEELEAYNETVESGSVAQAKFAIKSLYQRYQQAGSPAIFQGATKGTGVPPFESRQQVVEAMADKRYQKDPAYRAEVQKRLARSNV